MNKIAYSILFSLLLPAIAWSCICVEKPIEEMYRNSDAAFYGYIEQVPESTVLRSYAEGKSEVIPLFKFKIIESFKGLGASDSISMYVMYSTTCQGIIEKNIKIIAFAKRSKHGTFEVSKCSIYLAQKYYTKDSNQVGPSEKETKSKLDALRKLMSNNSFSSDALTRAV